MTTRTRPHIEHLQRRSLARVERRWNPDRGDLDLRSSPWRQERHQRRQGVGQGHSL